MLSRVAENLYWMARYMERAENTARLINTTTKVLLDLPRSATFGWDMLLNVAGLGRQFHEFYDEANESNIMRYLIEDERNASSIASCIFQARENTRTFREVVPVGFYERINGLYLYIRQNTAAALLGRSQRYQVLNSLIERRQATVGLLIGSMSQDVAYQFIKLGRNLERADMTTRIIDVNSAVSIPDDEVVTEPAQARLWMSVLTAISAYQMYRRHVGVHVRGPAVVKYLLTDSQFPRSVQHCLGEIEGCVAALPNHAGPLRALRRAWRRLSGIQLEKHAANGLHSALDEMQADLAEIHNELAAQYFHLYREDAPLQSQQQSNS